MIIKERLYSLILSEDEIKLFTELQDEDYLKRFERRKKLAKYGKHVGTVAGTALGATLGNKFGKLGMAGGAAIGGISGYFGGKKLGKCIEKENQKKIDQYNNASDEDKAYLRHKLEKQDDREAVRQAGYYAGSRQ